MEVTSANTAREARVSSRKGEEGAEQGLSFLIELKREATNRGASDDTTPTADPSELGSGKYKLSPGIRTSLPITFGSRLPESHKVAFDPLVKQIFSVAGDEDRKDINYTKFEVSLRDTWRQKLWLELTAKPVVDWERDAEAGSVLELEGGWIIARRWRVWLLIGARLWGEGVPSTYDRRISINGSVALNMKKKR